jgi:hypothetical protein
MADNSWVRTEVVQALRQGYSSGDEQGCVEGQADAIMNLIEQIASETDRFHLLIGWLNNLRLAVAAEGKEDRDA